MEAIRAVAAGDAVVAPRVTRRLIEMVQGVLPAAAGHGGVANDGGHDHPRLQGLTPREREVLQAVSEGLTNSEIAARFVIGEATVKTHVGNILTKLQLRDRVHAVIVAYETGLIELDALGFSSGD